MQGNLAGCLVLAICASSPGLGGALKLKANATLPDPTCSTGIISLPLAGQDMYQACCPAYCGECGDYATCASVRSQASAKACCATQVVEMKCGRGAAANVCLQPCSRSLPPCIMEKSGGVKVNTPKTSAADDCNKAVSEWRLKAAAAMKTTLAPTTTTTTTTTTMAKCSVSLSVSPYVQALSPRITKDQDGADWLTRSKMPLGVYTLFMVWQTEDFTGQQYWLGDDAGGDNMIDTRIGVGEQNVCGYGDGDYSGALVNDADGKGGNAGEMFGSDANSCKRNGKGGCPYVVFEEHGPPGSWHPKKWWAMCLSAKIEMDASTKCRDDPSKHCIVVAVRSGPQHGTYLQVNGVTSRSTKTIDPKISAMFGGNPAGPTLASRNFTDIQIFDSELPDGDVADMVSCLQSTYGQR